MENATKALVMAGTALIAILLISFLLLIFRKGGSANAEYNATMSDTELAKFNSQFEVYDVKNNTYFDVITVVNLARDLNKRNGYEIEVLLDDTEVAERNANMYVDIQKLTSLKDDKKKYKYLFKCTGIEYNNISGKVNKISFETVEQ